jgi:hypothetical protein
MKHFAHFEVSQLTSSMTTVHLSILILIIEDTRGFNAHTFVDKYLSLLQVTIRNSFEELILHLFCGFLLLYIPNLPLRDEVLVKRMRYTKLFLNSMETVEKRIQPVFLFASSSLLHHREKYLASPQDLKDHSFFDRDMLKKQQILMVLIRDLQFQAVLNDMIVEISE